MKHLDLFSGIGGFALAADRVWENVEHTFCDNDPFCQEVLKKHWPNSKIYDDIRTLTNTNWAGSRTPTSGTNTDRQTVHERQEEQPQSEPSRQDEVTTNTNSSEPRGERGQVQEAKSVSGVDRTTLRSRGSSRTCQHDGESTRVDLLTGGFPCQPFSQAGRKRGTEDDRYLWPEMLRVIKEFKPTWIIGENVAGIVNMVLEQVCLDLEAEGYEVQPLIIPAVAVNAPHRRDRVWIIAREQDVYDTKSKRRGVCDTEYERQAKREVNLLSNPDSNAPDTTSQSTRNENRTRLQEAKPERLGGYSENNWDRNWIEVATELCRVDDGLPKRLDRNPRLKALGNAIVPQVAEEIMRAIKER